MYVPHIYYINTRTILYDMHMHVLHVVVHMYVYMYVHVISYLLLLNALY